MCLTKDIARHDGVEPSALRHEDKEAREHRDTQEAFACTA
jgi:hypothetical protein